MSTTEVISRLQQILANEILAANQYILQAQLYDAMGFSELSNKLSSEHSEEIEHIKLITQRILQLNGAIQYSPISLPDKFGTNIQTDLENSKVFEQQHINYLKETITHLESVQDFASAELLCKILQQEEEQLHWLNTQLQLIAQLGIKAYTQSQIS